MPTRLSNSGGTFTAYRRSNGGDSFDYAKAPAEFALVLTPFFSLVPYKLRLCRCVAFCDQLPRQRHEGVVLLHSVATGWAYYAASDAQASLAIMLPGTHQRRSFGYERMPLQCCMGICMRRDRGICHPSRRMLSLFWPFNH